MNKPQTAPIEHGASHGTVTSYSIGFGLSILLTLTAFLLVEMHFWSGHVLFSHQFLYVAIVVCAVLQLLVQLICFLHLGRKSTPKWNFTAFAFASIVVFILVGGTLWIMHNLQHNMPAGASDTMQMFNGNIAPQNQLN